MSDGPRSASTNLSPALWPALLAGARVVVERHADGKLCDHCITPGVCSRLNGARTYLADPEMLRVEREATENKAKP
ncbi:hypothetical protein [Micromonospora sp. NBC_01796]|uniref:hypothetical protein n=1 Tax=Micromonospora sp. NBC_01796 TaxID=2975987 RepID=UPI002DD99511|nr:hypothetical protein [Micromonospora sp. NBC_01796]WSA88591.1 hypothetical protein OIE47_13850 [Micromonospora sp. NBC_01796]